MQSPSAAPAPMMEPEARQRFGETMFMASISPALFGFALFLSDQPALFWSVQIAFGVLMFAVRFWVLRSRDPRQALLAIHLLAGGGLFLVGWHAMYTGQSKSFALWFLPLIPLMSALLGNVRSAIAWSAASALVAGAVCLSEWYIRVPPALVLSPLLLLCGQLILMLVATSYGISARIANEGHVRSLKEANRQLLEQKELLSKQADALNRSLRDAEQARAAADAANRAKSDFLAMMSHEIRTPLNGVVGVHSLLLGMPLDDEARRYAELGQQSSEALLALINDVLDLSKIEAGALELETIDFDPRAVIEESVALVSPAARRKQLPVTSEVSAPASLRGDPTRLRQVLLNLLGNAVKFTEAGEVRVRCEMISRQGERAWLRFTVADTGIGIDPALQQRLFQPYSQADASTTRRFGGTGLGLAICKALTDLMGGRIRVESGGDGSRFIVELPFEASLQTPAHARVRALSAQMAETPAGTRGRVLVAEDNPVSAFVAAQMLRRLGCDVEVATDGRHAVELTTRQPFDLVLMDCEMPRLDGLGATAEIRAQPAGGRYLPIVAMTAGALAGDRERCLAAGMDDYLAKPARQEDLARILDRWLAG